MQMSEEMIEKYMPGAPEEDTRFPASTLPAAAWLGFKESLSLSLADLSLLEVS